MYANLNSEGLLPPRIILERIVFRGCSRMGETADLSEDGSCSYRTTRLNCSVSWKRYPPYKNSEFRGSKDTSKRSHHLSANRRRLDSLDYERGNHQLPRPESKHKTRRPGTLRDILRP